MNANNSKINRQNNVVVTGFLTARFSDSGVILTSDRDGQVVAEFGSTFEMNNWLSENRVNPALVSWGAENETATIELSRRW